jgi:hypothetical protein
MKTLEIHEINELYIKYVELYEKYLKQYDVKFIKYDNKKISQSLFAILFLLKYYGEIVTKKELTEGWNKIGNPTNDFQITRHLGLQFGYCIEKSGSKIFGWYKLLTLEKPHPSFIPIRRNQTFSEAEWETLKKEYEYRCQSCGVIDGDIHYKDKTMIAKLEKGHCDPRKELTLDNVFPQCNYCNQLYRNKFVFDKRGNVDYEIKQKKNSIK